MPTTQENTNEWQPTIIADWMLHKIIVCLCRRYWIDNYPMYFDMNAELTEVMLRLQDVIIQDDDEDSELAAMIDISKV